MIEPCIKALNVPAGLMGGNAYVDEALHDGVDKVSTPLSMRAVPI